MNRNLENLKYDLNLKINFPSIDDIFSKYEDELKQGVHSTVSKTLIKLLKKEITVQDGSSASIQSFLMRF